MGAVDVAFEDVSGGGVDDGKEASDDGDLKEKAGV